jgi:anti-sigma B factor antagonist
VALDITLKVQEAVAIVTVSGHLDATTASQLESILMNAYDSGSRLFLLECSRLTYVSSAGLRILLKVYKQINPMKGKLALAALQPHVANIFGLTGFNNIFPMHQTQGEAFRSLTEAGG